MILTIVIISVIIFVSIMIIAFNLNNDNYMILVGITLSLIVLLTTLTYKLGIDNTNEKVLIQLHREHKIDIITKTVLDSNYVEIYNMLENEGK